MVTAFLRLGTKYEIQSRRVEALQRLCIEYPTKLDIYLGRNHKKSTTLGIEQYSGQVVDTINLAREMGLILILPAAFALLCRKFTVEILLLVSFSLYKTILLARILSPT